MAGALPSESVRLRGRVVGDWCLFRASWGLCTLAAFVL